MTVYAGETVQIRVAATDFDASTPLDGGDISVFVTIYDSVPEEVLPEVEMGYDLDDEAFLYAWDTAGLAPGSYRARIEALGQQATPQSVSLEYKRIRLARRPVGN